jgi:hypothetical protein
MRSIHQSARKDQTLSVLLFTACFFLYFQAPITQITDSNYSMMVSQALLDHGTMRLDGYGIPRNEPSPAPGTSRNPYPYQLLEVHDRLYYYFPPGTSLLSVPLVAVCKAFRASPVTRDGRYSFSGEERVEKIVAAILTSVAVVFLFLTSRLSLNVLPSLALALTGAAGTSLASTASRAMWSHTWLVLLLSVSIFLIWRAVQRGTRPSPVLLASLAAWMYFVRPTAVISILAISILILLRFRSVFLTYTFVGLAWLAGFMLYSHHHFGQLLPPYYRASRLGSPTFLVALAGNMISPGRGWIFYTPFVLSIPLALWRHRKSIQDKPVLLLCLAVIAVHWIVISTFPQWWAGYCYGPRLMTDVIPWMMLAAVIATGALSAGAGPDREPAASAWPAVRLEIVLAALLIAASAFMHLRGAFDHAVHSWNTIPENIDDRPQRVWDWSYPQCLAGLIPPPVPERLAPLDLGERIALNGPQADPYLLVGWSAEEPQFRWTDGGLARIGFRLERVEPVLFRIRMAPFVVEGSREEQRVTVLLNRTRLTTLDLREPVQQEVSLLLPAHLLRRENILDFAFENLVSPASLRLNKDRRKLGVAAEWFEIDSVR